MLLENRRKHRVRTVRQTVRMRTPKSGGPAEKIPSAKFTQKWPNRDAL